MGPRLAALAALLTLACATPAQAALPPVKHVFVIVLENHDFADSFGAASPAPFLATELPKQGQLLREYYGIGHESLDNYIAMVSGQAPNPITQGDCFNQYGDMNPGTLGSDGQALGQGCVYPKAVKTLADQLEAKGLSWKGYMEDMGTPCLHPSANSSDSHTTANKDNQYATRHNPWMYFHTITDDAKRCAAHDVDLKALLDDLRRPETTPAFSFITPDLCSDGHDEPCADGRPGGLASEDAFLKQWVPQILASPAWADGAALIVTYDESGSESNADSCCGEQTGPNTPQPGITGPGGGQTGTVIISPWTAPGTINDTPYNHYSLLRSLEDLFGLDHLGYAGAGGLKPFGDDVFGAKRTAGLQPGPLTRCTAAKTGPVVSDLAIEKSKGRSVLRFRARRSGAVAVTVHGHRVARAPRRVRACKLYRVRLPGRHGRAVVRARGRARTQRY